MNLKRTEIAIEKLERTNSPGIQILSVLSQQEGSALSCEIHKPFIVF
jgi:hypothetical protein